MTPATTEALLLSRANRMAFLAIAPLVGLVVGSAAEARGAVLDDPVLSSTAWAAIVGVSIALLPVLLALVLSWRESRARHPVTDPHVAPHGDASLYHQPETRR